MYRKDGNNNDDTKDKVINLSDKMEQRTKERQLNMSDEQMDLHSALKLAVQEADLIVDQGDTKGLLVVAFSEGEMTPEVLLAGSINPFELAGFLTFIQTEVFNSCGVTLDPKDSDI